jgi:hypothetical protein
LVRFFVDYQIFEIGGAAGVTLLILVFFGSFCQKIQGENQLQKSEAFAFGDFISFDKRQKKRKQRKTLPRTELTGRVIDAGIFLIGILPRRKTPHIHVRRPPGLQRPILRIDLEKPKPTPAATTTDRNGRQDGASHPHPTGPPRPLASRRRRIAL